MKRIIQCKSVLRKIVVAILIVLLCYCIVPTYTYASFGGDILKVFTQLLAALGDVVTGSLNHFMLGTTDMINSVMLDRGSDTITNPEGALYAPPGEATKIVLGQDKDAAGNTDEELNEERIDGGLWGSDDEWQVPNILYSPEAIFSNRVAALDVNFLNPNSYNPVQDTVSAQEASQSSAEFLQTTISNWYVAFRNIAAVALLVVLVYIGIKILLGSVSEKAKYKEGLKDWFVAFCLVFIIHFIMSGILMVTQKVTELFNGASSGIIVEVREHRDDYNASTDERFKVSLIGVARLRVQSTNPGTSAAFCTIYMVLVVYTVMFTFTYFKRFLYMAFLTMIAPLVAISYPIDRMGDGHAQAFNIWFKEYTMNALIQPLHLILYTALVSSANDLVVKNPIYAIVAIAFLIPAEKFVKKMFGFDKAETPGSLGGFAAGAVTMGAMQRLSNMRKFIGDGNDKTKQDKVRTADNNGGNDYLSSNPRYGGISDVSGSLRGSNNDGGSGAPAMRVASENGQEGEGSSPAAMRIASGDQGDGGSVPSATSVTPGEQGDGGSAGAASVNFADNAGQPGDSRSAVSTSGSDLDLGEGSERREFKESLGTRAWDWTKGKASNLANRSIDKAQELGKSFANTKVGGGIVAAGTWAGNTKVGRGARAVGRGAKRLAINRNTKAVGKMALKGAKTLGKGVWKNKGKIAKTLATGALSASGAALGAGIGLATGLASGDPSKVWSNMATGMVSGGMIGKNTSNLVTGAVSGVGNFASNTVADAGRGLRYSFLEARDGIDKAESVRQHNEDQRKYRKFLKDEEQIKKAKKIQAQLMEKGQKAELKDIMKSRYDYIAAGIKDSEIEKAQIAEAKNGINGSTHGNYVALAAEANKLGINKATFSDDKKYNEFLNTLSANLGGEEQGKQAMGIIADIKGASVTHQEQLTRRQAKKEQEAQAQQEAEARRAQQEALQQEQRLLNRRQTEALEQIAGRGSQPQPHGPNNPNGNS